MQSQNKSERKSAFLRFLLFFIITVSLIVLAVYFGTRVPVKENNKLREKLEAYEMQDKTRDEIMAKIKIAYSLLDTVNIAGLHTDIIDGRISQTIKEIDAAVSKVETGNKSMYEKIIKALNDRQYDKKMLRSTADFDERLVEKDRLIEQITKNRDSWKERSEQLQQQIMMMQR